MLPKCGKLGTENGKKQDFGNNYHKGSKNTGNQKTREMLGNSFQKPDQNLSDKLTFYLSIKTGVYNSEATLCNAKSDPQHKIRLLQ